MSNFLKIFIVFYALFTIFVQIFGISDIGIKYEEIILPTSLFNFSELLTFGAKLGEYLLGLITYSTPVSILNIVLWAFRIIAIIELIILVKRIIHPTTV